MSSAVVLARVEPAIKALIKERVEKEGRTISDVTRELIEKGLETENMRRTVELLEKEKIKLESEKKALLEEITKEREDVKKSLDEIGKKVDEIGLGLKTFLDYLKAKIQDQWTPETLKKHLKECRDKTCKWCKAVEEAVEEVVFGK